MTGIIEQIQRDALNPEFPVSALLRKVKLAAAKLKLEKVEDWVDHELKGYDDDVPAYRVISGRPQGFTGRYWIPLAGDAETIAMISHAPVRQSIATIEALIMRQSDATPQYPLAPEQVSVLSKLTNIDIARVSIFFDRSLLTGIVDGVRTAVLEWAIELEKAGVMGSALSFTSEEQEKARDASVNINIGTIQSFAGNLGSHDVSGDVIVSTLTIEKVRDFVNQVKPQIDQLEREGVDRTELTTRLRAIEKALDDCKPASVTSQLLEELKGTVAKAGSKLISSGVLSMLNQLLGTGVPSAFANAAT
jgi:hypothetical protein